MKSLIFTAENVLACRDGLKTQTRRVMRIQPPANFPHAICDAERCCWADTLDENFMANWPEEPILAPLKVGDRFYAKEKFGVDDGKFNCPDFAPFVFFADDAPKEITQEQFESFRRPDLQWHSPLFLPEWASRFVGEITSLRAERVKDISEADAKAEGVKPVAVEPLAAFFRTTSARFAYRDSFKAAWIAMHGEESWERDWVWVYEFEEVERGS